MMNNRRILLAKWVLLALSVSACFGLFVADSAHFRANAQRSDVPELNELDAGKSELRPIIERYVADRGSLLRSYPVEASPTRMARFQQFYSDWLSTIGKMNFDALSQDGKAGYVAAPKAAYRFFDNEEVQPAAILAPPHERVCERMQGQRVVLAIQATTELAYSAHPATKGLEPMGNNCDRVQGLLLQTTLAVTGQGRPLGLLTQQIWARGHPPRQPTYEHKATALADKESAKWLQALKLTGERAPREVQDVLLCNREADTLSFC